MKKTFLTTLLLAAFTLMLSIPAQADLGYVNFSTFGTAYNGSITNWAVISDNSRLPYASPLITFISATSDLSTSKLQFYTCTNSTREAGGTTNSTTTLYVNSTNGFAAAQYVVIEHVPTDTYEFGVISAVQNTNQIVLQFAPAAAVMPGDNVYLETASAYIPVGAATLTLTGTAGIYTPSVFNRPKLPLLITLTGTSSSSINAISATYQ